MTNRLGWLLSLALAVTVSAHADEWKKVYPISSKATIHVDTNDASIEVRASDRKDVEARVLTEGYEIGPGKIRVTEHQTGDRIDLEVRRPIEHFVMNFRSRWVRIELYVPRDLILDLHSGDGHIRVDDVRGDVRLDTGDGHVEANRVDGTLHVHTGDGRVTVDGRFDDLDIRTSDGHVEADVRAGSKVATSWSIRTGDGGVSLRLPDNLSADLDLHTGDGRVTVDLPLTISGTQSRSSLRGKLNNGGPLVEVRTGDGSIRVGRS